MSKSVLSFSPLPTPPHTGSSAITSGTRLRLGPRAIAALASLCAAAGLFTIYSTVQSLLQMWRTDDLKSVGLLVPFLSFALILRAWRALGWEIDGSWWGFALLAGTTALMFLRDQTLFVLTVHKDWL